MTIYTREMSNQHQCMEGMWIYASLQNKLLINCHGALSNFVKKTTVLFLLDGSMDDNISPQSQLKYLNC